jgi:hypothetical protein
MTDEMRVIRAFSLLFVDVFSTVSRLCLVVERVLIFSLLVSASSLIERRLEVERTTAERRLSVSCLLHVVLQTICQNQQFFLDDE